MPTKRESRLAQQENLKETFKIDDKTYHAKKYLTWGILGVLVLAGLVVFFIKAGQPSKFDVSQACLRAENYHIHPNLTITINGESQVAPKGLGIVSPTCIRPLHIHENDGKIHVEFDYPRDFTLGEFFKVWEKPFNKNQIFDYKVDATHELTLTVDGQPSEAWENLVFKDQQKIVINYRTKTP